MCTRTAQITISSLAWAFCLHYSSTCKCKDLATNSWRKQSLPSCTIIDITSSNLNNTCYMLLNTVHNNYSNKLHGQPMNGWGMSVSVQGDGWTDSPVCATGIRIVDEGFPNVIGPLCREVECSLLKKKPHELEVSVHKLHKERRKEWLGDLRSIWA